jgi:hypothetical protein
MNREFMMSARQRAMRFADAEWNRRARNVVDAERNATLTRTRD